MKKILFFTSLLLLTGCVSRQSVQTMIDAQIAAHHDAVVAPQMTNLDLRVRENSRQIAESSEQVAVHKGVLLDTFEQQRKAAEAAIRMLEPVPVVVEPATNAPIEEVEEAE